MKHKCPYCNKESVMVLIETFYRGERISSQLFRCELCGRIHETTYNACGAGVIGQHMSLWHSWKEFESPRHPNYKKEIQT